MTAVEKAVYTPNPDNPNETIAIKECWVESRLYGLRSAVKNFGIERFKSNCLRATEGFNFVLHHLNNQTTVANIRDMRAKWKEMKDRGEEAFYGKMGNIKSIVGEKS